MNSPMLTAFLKQQKFTDKQADDHQANILNYQETNLAKAEMEMHKCQDLQRFVNIPSKLKPGEIDQKHEVHAKLKGYDHSLESVRIKFESKQQVISENAKVPAGLEYKLPEGQAGIDWSSLAKSLGL